MKNITIYTTFENINNGDSFSKSFFTAEEAISYALYCKDHLAASELTDRTIFVLGYSISLPDEYSVSSPKALEQDLYNGDVECEQYDSCAGSFVDGAQCFCKVVL